MADTTKISDLTIDHQIRLVTDLRNDLRVLLGAHPNGVWFQMLPQAFHLHFNRDIQLATLDIHDPHSLLDCISDIVKFDLSDEGTDDDFVIELINDRSMMTNNSMRATDLQKKRDILFKMLRDPNTSKRGSLWREICIIDEQLDQIDEESESTTISSPSLLPVPETLPAPTHEQVAVRLQKVRSMIDVCLRHIFKSSEHISDGELTALYEHCDRFIINLTPLAQHFSSTALSPSN